MDVLVATLWSQGGSAAAAVAHGAMGMGRCWTRMAGAAGVPPSCPCPSHMHDLTVREPPHGARGTVQPLGLKGRPEAMESAASSKVSLSSSPVIEATVLMNSVSSHPSLILASSLGKTAKDDSPKGKSRPFVPGPAALMRIIDGSAAIKETVTISSIKVTLDGPGLAAYFSACLTGAGTEKHDKIPISQSRPLTVSRIFTAIPVHPFNTFVVDTSEWTDGNICLNA